MMMNRLQRNDEPHRPVSIASIESIWNEVNVT
jgi:hypothetical protein